MKRPLPLILLAVGCSPSAPPSAPASPPRSPEALPAPLDQIFADLQARNGTDFWKVPPGRIDSPAHPNLLLNYPVIAPAPSTYSRLVDETTSKFTASLQANEATLQAIRTETATAKYSPSIVIQWAAGLYAQRRAYAQVGYDYRDGYVGRAELGIVRWLLAEADPKNDFAYTRQRFILESVFGDVASIPVGRALLAKTPDDAELRRAFAFHLAHSDQRNELDEAIRIATDLARKDPTRLSFVRLPALVYQNRFNCLGRRREDRIGEIDWLKRYIAIAERSARPRGADGVDAVASARRRLSEIMR